MKILITGTAGFIGFHLAKRLLDRGDEVVGIDNINNYYDVNLKYKRLAQHGIFKNNIKYGKPIQSLKYDNYIFYQTDLRDNDQLKTIFHQGEFDAVCNLAAQAGVRYSLTNPQAYVDSNIHGFLNILEACRYYQIKHLVYASSSSVYGLNKQMPFSTHHNVDHPISLYAASKKSNELMAHTYSYLFKLPTTGLRFFTVYGPWGRPDMALFLFTEAIMNNKPIQLFNEGNMRRDFTFIDDIIEGIVRVIDHPATINQSWDEMYPDSATSSAPYQVFNIGRGNPVNLLDFVDEIEKNLGIRAIKEYLPMQAGDVAETWADIKDLQNILGYQPHISVQEGIKRFIDWYKAYYEIPINQKIES